MTVRTLLFTDVVDSTRMVASLGDARAAEVWAEHDRRARDLLAHHHGREIGRADGFFLLFDDPSDATRYALAYHEALADLALNARVGIHVGPVTLRENTPQEIARGAISTEVEGLATPLAARVMALARGGQTLLTAAARDALGGTLPKAGRIESHGYYRLKGIEEPAEILELGVSNSSPFSPPADVEKAYRVVRDGEAWRPVREVRHNLIAERDAFVGRTVELHNLAARLDSGARLLTVLGPGGTGKTRCVQRYGRTWLGDWPGGVYFCDLSEAQSLDGIFFAVASALEIPLGKDDSAVQLGHAIAGRGRCLVILDNFEQVVVHAPATVGCWLDFAPDAAFLVTSRERLHLSGEEAFPIEPLPLKEDAIDLFTTRARAQRPDFALTESNRAAVAEVVRLLDGLPLAIELAAARVRILSPAQLVERMRDRFTLLAGARGAAPRQATLHATIDWSWDLLAAWEKAAFAECAAFDGGFTLEAAEAVLDLASWPQTPPVMDVIHSLADKCLLRTWVPTEQLHYDIDEPYFGMYLSIREYAAEKLVAAGPHMRRGTEERHGRYFARFGADEALEALSAEGGVRRRRVLALELDNLVAACRRAAIRNDPASAIATFRAAWEVLALRGPFLLAIELGEHVRSLDSLDDEQRISAAATLSDALLHAGRVEEARTRLGEGLALARAKGYERHEGRALLSLGSLNRVHSRNAEAKACYQAALAIAHRTGDRASEGRARSGLGTLNRELGQTEEAREQLEAALAIARDMNDRREEGTILASLGILNTEVGRVDEARNHLQAALSIAGEMGDLVVEGSVQANLGRLCSEQGDFDQAPAHFAAALSIHREVGDRQLEAIDLGNLGPLYTVQGRTSEALDCYERALAIAREVGNRRHQGFLFVSLGILRHAQGRVAEARRDYGAALALAQEVHDPRGEGIALSRLAQLNLEQGQVKEARTFFERALSLARESGFRRLEGVVLGSLGPLLMREGRASEAIATVRAGEAVLRAIADREELCKLLCVRGEIEATLGELDQARAALAEAEAIAKSMAVHDSETSRVMATLRKSLA